MKILRLIAGACLIAACVLIGQDTRAQGGPEAMNTPGAHLVLSLNMAEARAYWVSSLGDEVRHRLRKARIPFGNIAPAGNVVQVRLIRPEDADAALETLTDLSLVRGSQESDVAVAKGESGSTTITPTEAGLERRTSAALDETVAIVARRLKAMGVTAGTVRRGRDQIYVHAPRLQDIARLKELLTRRRGLRFTRCILR